MRSADLADPGWLRTVARRHHRAFGLDAAPRRVELLDAQIKRPQGGRSSRVRGWASVRVDGTRFVIRSVGPAPPEPCGTPLAGLPLRVWRFPHDPGLPDLPALASPGTARSLLPQQLAATHRVESVQVVTWRPGATATVRCTLTSTGSRRGPTVYGKLLGPTDPAHVHDLLRALSHAPPAGALRVADPLGLAPDRPVLWTADVGGRDLVVALTGQGQGPSTEEIRAVGRSLAGLHHVAGPLPAQWIDPAAVAAEAAKKGRKLLAARPVRQVAIDRLVAMTADLTRTRAGERRLVHGDCHVGQLRLTSQGPVLLDLDDAAVGDPALDLAELGVDLGLRLPPGAPRARFLRLVGEAYEAAGGDLPRDGILRAYGAAELLNRCYRHLRCPSPGWQAALDSDLAAQDAVLAGLSALSRPTRRTVDHPAGVPT